MSVCIPALNDMSMNDSQIIQHHQNEGDYRKLYNLSDENCKNVGNIRRSDYLNRNSLTAS